MDPKSIAFVTVMVAIAAIALVVWLVYFVASRRAPAAGPDTPAQAPGQRWYEYLLAAGLLVALVAIVVLLLVWGVSSMPGDGAAENGQAATANWRAGSKSIAFLVILMLGGGLGLLAFLVFVFTRLPSRTGGAAGGQAAVAATSETPSGARLLGLLILTLAVLLMGWLYLPPEQQYELMLRLIYPAGLAVSLVLLFDKATRSWSPKSTWANLREWLYCDALVFFLLLGFVNLLRSTTAELYGAFFWDVLYIVLFFFIFWLLDRGFTRYRFLVAQGYLALLPILLFIWRMTQEVTQPEDVSWWGTLWPFFFLALIFFVLEIITLVASQDAENRALPAIKDILFVVLYAILLIIAIPEAAEVVE